MVSETFGISMEGIEKVAS